jgi:hypothetical protein
LLRKDFNADERERIYLNKILIEQAGVCAWNLNISYQCPHHSKIPFLKEEMDKEFHKSIRLLFDFLKLAYDKNSIEAVLENLEAGTGQSISFAVELIDTFVEEDIKPYIVPLLEDVSIANKIWALENYFPLRTYTTESLLNAVINRDNNLISKQAKIFALNAYQHIEMSSVSSDLIAQMFNTDKILRQLSAQIIESVDRGKYLDCKKRLSDKLRVELDKQLLLFQTTGLSVTNRISFYQSLFKGESKENDILYLLYQTSIIKLNETNILGLELFKDKAYILFIESGGAQLYNGDELIKEYSTGDMINTFSVNKSPWRLITQGNSVIHYIEYDKVVNSIYDKEFLVKYLDNTYLANS